MTEKQADMTGDNHNAETQGEPQTQKGFVRHQAAKEQLQMISADWDNAVAERDEIIADLMPR